MRSKVPHNRIDPAVQEVNAHEDQFNESGGLVASKPSYAGGPAWSLKSHLQRLLDQLAS